MTAIVTDKLKFKYTDLLYNEIISTVDTNHYYIGIGKSDQYDSADDTVINPTNTLLEEMDARHNLESIIKVIETDMSYAVPRNNWSSGTKYNGWNDKQVGYPSDYAYYVMTEDQQVYICLQASKGTDGTLNPSTVKPSYATHPVTYHRAFKTSDGYIWKFLYEITAARSNIFLTSGYLPIQLGDSSSPGAPLVQADVEATTKIGQITGFEIIDGGEGYGSAPTVTITGNGTGAIATATRDPATNTISKIEMTCPQGDSGMGTGYTFARGTLSGGGSPTRAAEIRPIFGPLRGFGKDARQDLKSSSLMFNTKPTGDVSGAFSISNIGATYGGQADYRQISLLRNLDYVDSAADGVRVEQAQARVSRLIMTSGTGSGTLVRDEKITGGTSGTVAWVDQIDTVDNQGAPSLGIHYHINSRKDLKPGIFTNGETVTGSPSGGTATVDSDSQPGSGASRKMLTGTQTDRLGAIDKYSGDVLYIDNRTRIIRSSTQTEDIKIILSV